MNPAVLLKGSPESDTRIPHQVREKHGVGRHGRTPHVSRAFAIGTNNVIVLYSDGDRLRVSEAVGWGMAARAGVVVVQAGDCVEPEEPTEIGEIEVQVAPDLFPQGRLDRSSEMLLVQHGDESCIQLRIRRDGLLSRAGFGLVIEKISATSLAGISFLTGAKITKP